MASRCSELLRGANHQTEVRGQPAVFYAGVTLDELRHIVMKIMGRSHRCVRKHCEVRGRTVNGGVFGVHVCHGAMDEDGSTL